MTDLKKVLISEPCLSLPEADNPEFLVRTDASDFGIGATLRQKQCFEEKVLAYFSRKLHGAKTPYSTYDKELLAIRDALKHWCYYLLGRHTTISTDHASLRHMLSQPKLSQRQMRALEDMLEYDFDIEYLLGAKNYIQDALSRRPDYHEPPILRSQVGLAKTGITLKYDGSQSEKEEVEKEKAEKEKSEKEEAENKKSEKEKVEERDGDFVYHRRPTRHIKSTPEVESELFDLVLDDAEEWMTSIRKGYQGDPYCQDILKYLVNGSQVQASRQRSPAENRQHQADSRRQKARGQHYEVDEDGFIIHRMSGTLAIPNLWDVKSRILAEAHDSTVGGHFGTQRTYSTIVKRFFWPRMFQEVKRYVKGCGTCARTKPSNQKPYGLLQPLDIPDERWRRINIDFITKLLTTRTDQDTIITIIDALTKRAHWIATKESELTAAKFAEIFRDQYIRLHGLPDVIVSDWDVRFTSAFWKTLMKEFDTKLAMSTAFHPQTDGQAEKANSIVERYLRAYTTDRQDDWDQMLAMAEFAYNASRQKSLEMSPFEADLGYIPRVPLDAVVGLKKKRQSHHDGLPFAVQMTDTLMRLRLSLQRAQEQQIAEAKKHRQPHSFQKGDKILLSTKNMPVTYGTATDDHRKALHHRYIGEFEHGRQRGENAFEVLLPSHWKLSRTFNVDKFRPSNIDHSRHQGKVPALRVTGIRNSKAKEAEYAVEEIRSWRRNADMGGRIEYEVKWEDDEDLTWEPEEMFAEGGKEILEEFQAKDEELQHLLAGKEKPVVKRVKRKRRRQAYVMEVKDGEEPTEFHADDWEEVER